MAFCWGDKTRPSGHPWRFVENGGRFLTFLSHSTLSGSWKTPKSLICKEWWLGPESNRGHEDFQSSALPTELPSRKREGKCDGFSANGKLLFRKISGPILGASMASLCVKTLKMNQPRGFLFQIFSLEAQQPAPTAPAIDPAAFERAAARVLDRHTILLQKLAS